MCICVCPVCHKLHEVHDLKLSLNMRLYIYRPNGNATPNSHTCSWDVGRGVCGVASHDKAVEQITQHENHVNNDHTDDACDDTYM